MCLKFTSSHRLKALRRMEMDCILFLLVLCSYMITKTFGTRVQEIKKKGPDGSIDFFLETSPTISIYFGKTRNWTIFREGILWHFHPTNSKLCEAWEVLNCKCANTRMTLIRNLDNLFQYYTSILVKKRWIISYCSYHPTSDRYWFKIMSSRRSIHGTCQTVRV